MNGDLVIYLAKQALVLSILIGMPAILVAATVGLMFSIFQTLTQIQDQTLSFAVKLMFTLLTIYLSLDWSANQLYQFTLLLYQYKW